ncbi:MAG: SDR family oxidoreductase [Rhodoplanes sp.]
MKAPRGRAGRDWFGWLKGLNMKNKAILLTGVTGALGQDVIREVLATGNETLFLLIRRKKRLSQRDRARKLLAKYGYEDELGARVYVLEGDVTHLHFGLKEAEMDVLREKITDFYHIAALTSLNAAETACNRANVNGTENALQLAWDLYTNGELQRFHYFSTAYAVGSLQTYHSYEDSLPEKPVFANFYESSKFIAETKVRKEMEAGLPATIFRPSIVVGDSRTGEVSEFNVIYPFLKLFVSGVIKVLPTHLENPFNIVPIDFVVKASVAISRQKNSLGKSYHLVSDDPPTIGMILRLKNEVYPGMPEIKVVDPEEFKASELNFIGKMAYKMLNPYLGYLNERLTFDTKNAHEALDSTDIGFPDTGYDFLKTIVGYAVDAGYLKVTSR